jgi:hypothetical protein
VGNISAVAGEQDAGTQIDCCKELKISLVTASIQTAPQYAALSYT